MILLWPTWLKPVIMTAKDINMKIIASNMLVKTKYVNEPGCYLQADEWGMSSNTSCLVPDDSGYAVKFEDYCKLETELVALKAELREICAAIDDSKHQANPLDAATETTSNVARRT